MHDDMAKQSISTLDSEPEIRAIIQKWKDEKRLHKHEEIIIPGIFMIEARQMGIAKELAYEKVGFWEAEMSDVPELEEKALDLADEYFEIMDENFPYDAIKFMKKMKLGKNIDELIEEGSLMLDIDDIVFNIMKNPGYE